MDTVIDGEMNSSVVSFKSAEGLDSVPEGFTIKNGKDVTGGGIWNTSSPEISNNIVWDNSAPEDPEIYRATTQVTYSLVKSGWFGIGNIDADFFLLIQLTTIFT